MGQARRTLGLWSQDNVTASQTAVDVNLYGGTTRSKRVAMRMGSSHRNSGGSNESWPEEPWLLKSR